MSRRIILLQALTSTPRDLRRALKNVDERVFRTRAPRLGSTLAEEMALLIAHEDEYRRLFRMVVEQDRPHLSPLETRADGFVELPPEESLDRFAVARDETLAFLQGLSPGQWQRPANHTTRGRILLRFLVQDLMEHDIYRMNRLLEIKNAIKNTNPLPKSLT